MPGLDGTGPSGHGPRTGRGAGKCRGFLSGPGTAGSSMRRTLWITVIGAVAGDLSNPDGISRRLAAGAGRMLKRLGEARNARIARTTAKRLPAGTGASSLPGQQQNEG